MKYKVHGYAMVPCEVQMEIVADGAAEAIRKAIQTFKKSDRKGDFVVINSEDPSHPEQWVPSLCEVIE